MNTEELIQFIVNQQAQNVADIHSLQEFQRELGQKIDKLHETVKQHEDHHIVTGEMVARLASWQEDDSERIDWLFESHKKLIEKQDWLDNGFKKLVEFQLRTDAKVDKLADTVDKLATKVDQLAGTVDKLATTVDTVADTVDKVADKLDRFIDEVRKNVTGRNGKRRKNGK